MQKSRYTLDGWAGVIRGAKMSVGGAMLLALVVGCPVETPKLAFDSPSATMVFTAVMNPSQIGPILAGSNSPVICDRAIGAIVLNNDQQLGNLSVTVDQVPQGSIDSIPEPALRNFLATELESAGVFDPQLQYLFYIGFVPSPCMDGLEVALDFQVFENNTPIIPARFTIGGTFESLVPQINNFAFFDTAVAPMIPTVTQWGLIIMTVAGLIVGTIVFGGMKPKSITR